MDEDEKEAEPPKPQQLIFKKGSEKNKLQFGAPAVDPKAFNLSFKTDNTKKPFAFTDKTKKN